MTKIKVFECFGELPVVYEQVLEFATAPYNIFNTTLLFRKSKIMSSGTDVEKQISVNKACSEAVERIFFEKFSGTSKFRFDFINSTDCMAAGFGLNETIRRSNAEAVERYVKLLVAEGRCSVCSVDLLDYDLGIYAAFSEHNGAYVVKVNYCNFSGALEEVFFGIVTCRIGTHFVTGSAVRDSLSEALAHSFIEARRNLFILQNMNNYPYNLQINSHHSVLSDISENGDQVDALLKNDVPTIGEIFLPKISWQEVESFMGLILCRSFVQGFQFKNDELQVKL